MYASVVFSVVSRCIALVFVRSVRSCGVEFRLCCDIVLCIYVRCVVSGCAVLWCVVSCCLLMSGVVMRYVTLYYVVVCGVL